MADWTGEYKNKLRTIDEAIEALPTKASVIMGMASMETQGFMSRVHEHAEHFERLHVLSCLNLGSYPFCEDPAYQGTFVNDNWFYGPSNRAAAKAGYKLVDFIPNNLHRAGTDKLVALKEEGHTIVYWGPVTPMQDRTGFFNLGLSNVYELEVIEAADIVVLEVNRHVPWIHGDTQVHLGRAGMIVEHDAELPTIPILPPGETEKQIASHITPLVSDGATLQIGIGGIPNAVAAQLSGKRELGIHTEMFTESMIDLFDEGVISNTKKTLWPGKFVFTFALGSARMYEWLDDNPSVIELRGSYVNNPYVISQNDNMVSINTALSVDLTGQVCSESLAHVQYSGTGGQLDTHRGASMSRGGKGIIALRSTAKKGTLSTITPTLAPGSAVTVPRQDLDWVVTEHGAVHMKGRTAAERAAAMIAIAHPDFRDELTREAKKLGYV